MQNFKTTFFLTHYKYQLQNNNKTDVCSLYLTTTDKSILQIILLFWENHFVVSALRAVVVCFFGSQVRLRAPSMRNCCKFQNRFVLLWLKFNNPWYTTICCKNCFFSTNRRYKQSFHIVFWYKKICSAVHFENKTKLQFPSLSIFQVM